MNPLIQYTDGNIDKNPMGSGRYYGRLSQSELVPAPISGGIERTLMFEAFDAQWFDNNPPPESPDELAKYYDSASLFLLQARVLPTNMPSFHILEYLAKYSDDDDELDAWFTFVCFPSEGRALSEKEFGINVFANIYQPGIEMVTQDFREVEGTTTAMLRKAVSTSHFKDATEKEIDDALNKIKPIDWAIVYDVGQGNSIGLCNSDGSVEAYFDLGGGVLANAKTFPPSLKRFCFSQEPPIILSHWDFDHWSSANRDPRSHGMKWIAPRQSVGPSHVALMTSIMASGKLLLVPSSFSTKWRGQIQLECCNGRGRNHSGLALTLSEKSGGRGEQMLFPGDARYTCLPSFSTSTKYLSVVAPHHGADMRNRTVPDTRGLGHSRFVYSFGNPNTFSHPRMITRGDHHAKGWHDPHVASGFGSYAVRETANRPTSGLGHVLLPWKSHSSMPPLHCGGGSCQLQAQQL